ncbi:MAG TPA: bifunctional precorrin-2 dehydrogenase/sirohydrochlorin ferrochelatase [Candidatus Angelobacter sp.]|nr:bifunctional precorrin-2 dehydrogenase/sirohydrochlorin ferrochelatase [Candidatus Angelobacter sp.]
MTIDSEVQATPVLYPMFLKLEARKVLIVGGGKIAEEKIYAVLRSATDVTVVSPIVSEQIRQWVEQGRLKHIADEYRVGMAREYFLVIACTDLESVNRSVYEEAKCAGVLCNAVDDPEYCDFYAPAVVNRGHFQIAISTGGNSPALAQKIRKKLELQFGPEYESWTNWLGRVRAGLVKAMPRSERRKEILHLLTYSK